jgi:hypothetical protein
METGTKKTENSPRKYADKEGTHIMIDYRYSYTHGKKMWHVMLGGLTIGVCGQLNDAKKMRNRYLSSNN